MPGRLQDKVVIITGAASRAEGVGTGKAMALLSAREGAKVVLVNRSIERADALRAEIVSEGGAAMAFAGDVTLAADTEAMAAAALEHFGRIDVLVNNAGGGFGPGGAANVEQEAWDKTIALNLTAAMLSAKACLPAMQRQGSGSVINISSVVGATGLMSQEGSVAYASAKAGMHGLTHSIAADYAKDGVRSNCIVVGTVHTPMVAHWGEEYRERRRQMVPLKTEGTGWDVAWGMVYLASEEARWVTGLMLPIDGGLLNVRDWPR